MKTNANMTSQENEAVRNYVDTKHGIKLHFSSVHAIVKEIW